MAATPTPAAPPLLRPDGDFTRAILGLGAHDLSACYQCGTCSTVCPLAPADNPFPRKEMVWVQWGLKQRALSNASIWLCHQCGACTAYCPRGARPADVMAALRDYSIGHYAVPQWLGRAVQRPRALPLLFALPVVILLGVLAALGHLAALPTGRIVYSKFFPVESIDAVFVTAVTLSLLGGLLGARRYWRAMSAESHRTGRLRMSPLQTLRTIVSHRRFRACREPRPEARRSYKEHLATTHQLVFFGFLGLLATTISVGVGLYVFHAPTPWPEWNPVKIMGNLSGLAVIAAIGIFAYRRQADQARAGKSTYSDWLFLYVLVLTVLTGFATELLRLANLPRIAYPTYFVHLVFIFFLLVYLPYSKFAHLIYRTTAMLFSPAGGESVPKANA